MISCRTGVPHVPRRSPTIAAGVGVGGDAAASAIGGNPDGTCREVDVDDCSEATDVESTVARNFSTHDIVSIAVQVLSAIKFLHVRNVTHGDIAARNCVYVLANFCKNLVVA